MERVHTLINKLQEQANNGNTASQILSTAQLLVAELSGIELPEEIGKVSVWMPSVYFSSAATEIVKENTVSVVEELVVPSVIVAQEEVIMAPEPMIEKVVEKLNVPVEIIAQEETIVIAEPMTAIIVEELIVPDEMAHLDEIVEMEEEVMPIVVAEIATQVEVEPVQIVAKEEVIIPQSQPVEVAARRAAMIAVKPKEIYNFNVFAEEEQHEEPMPTLTLHTKKETFELNDLISNQTQSFNDVLRENKKEVVATLIDTPVKDLRKAIGINEKYLYINELFQGDENMYERSIKTINGFSVFPEAEHWIRRELHTRLCWINDNATVKQFDQLVRRRFA